MDPATSWKRVNDFLGIQRNSSPTEIKIKNNEGHIESITEPMKLATEFNQYFRQKINVLRQKTDIAPNMDPSEDFRNGWKMNTSLLRHLD